MCLAQEVFQENNRQTHAEHTNEFINGSRKRIFVCFDFARTSFLWHYLVRERLAFIWRLWHYMQWDEVICDQLFSVLFGLTSARIYNTYYQSVRKTIIKCASAEQVLADWKLVLRKKQCLSRAARTPTDTQIFHSIKCSCSFVQVNRLCLSTTSETAHASPCSPEMTLNVQINIPFYLRELEVK